jgi:glycosyltransferase involved in cell wall biosynthesis
MNKLTFLSFALLFFLSGCGLSPTMVEDFADDSKEEIATTYIQQIIDGDFEKILDSIEPKLRPKIDEDILEQMRSLLGSDEVKEVNLVGYNAHTFNQQPTRYNLSYQYGYGNKWILVNVAFRSIASGKNEILGLNIYNPMSKPLQEINRFRFEGKSIIHYIFLGLCISIPLFSLFTLVACIRTKIKKKKWLWIVFILFGIGQFSINWTTGQFGFKPISIQLFGFGAVAVSIYAPWILLFSIPIGAILFWIRRNRIKM